AEDGDREQDGATDDAPGSSFAHDPLLGSSDRINGIATIRWRAPVNPGHPLSLRRSGVSRAPEPEVAGRAVRGVRAPSGHAVAVAVRAMTEIGAAAHDVARADLRAARVAARSVDVERRVEPVSAPFPDIAGHVVEPIAVG